MHTGYWYAFACIQCTPCTQWKDKARGKLIRSTMIIGADFAECKCSLCLSRRSKHFVNDILCRKMPHTDVIAERQCAENGWLHSHYTSFNDDDNDVVPTSVKTYLCQVKNTKQFTHFLSVPFFVLLLQLLFSIEHCSMRRQIDRIYILIKYCIKTYGCFSFFFYYYYFLLLFIAKYHFLIRICFFSFWFSLTVFLYYFRFRPKSSQK